MEGKLVQRADKVAFYGVKGEGDAVVYHRMKGFTDLSTSKNPKEYSRQYVDEYFEQTDVSGYSPSIAYGFDHYVGDPVHADLVKITDDELLGSDAVRSIIMVDMTQETAGKFKAVKRDFSVIPDSEGDSMDAYTYSGNMKVKGDKVVGQAAITDDTLTFTEDGASA